MIRAGTTPTIAELMALLAANAAENATLRADRDALAQRVFKLEEDLALAQLHRFAPRSEKRVDRASSTKPRRLRSRTMLMMELPTVTRLMSPRFPTRNCRRKGLEAASAGVNVFRQIRRANASNMTLPTIRRPVRAGATHCIAWANSSPSS